MVMHERTPITHPPRPNPVVLEDEIMVVKPDGTVCMAPAEVDKLLRNKTELLRWLEESSNLIDYYRSLD